MLPLPGNIWNSFLLEHTQWKLNPCPQTMLIYSWQNNPMLPLGWEVSFGSFGAQCGTLRTSIFTRGVTQISAMYQYRTLCPANHFASSGWQTFWDLDLLLGLACGHWSVWSWLLAIPSLRTLVCEEFWSVPIRAVGLEHLFFSIQRFSSAAHPTSNSSPAHCPFCLFLFRNVMNTRSSRHTQLN